MIGLVGSVLDAGFAEKRWEKWRPTVAIGQHDDLQIDRLELLHQPKDGRLLTTVVEDFHQVSPETAVRTHAVDVADPWDFEAMYAALLSWAESMKLDEEKADYLVHMTTGTHVAQICWFLLVESRRIPGKLLQIAPPKKSEHSPGTWRTIDLDLARYDKLAARFAEDHAEDVDLLKRGIATRNKAFNRLIDYVGRIAVRSREPMLLTGPTGAGKSQLARQVFELKKRRGQVKGRFVEVNCATLRGDTAAGALFGHTKGAFTGAATARDGLLRSADGGVLFLDEIGELGLDEQAMLLRAIEEKTFLPVGSDEPVASDFDLLAGTNRDLATDRFRDDLLARINLWSVELPSLRERPEDIEPNLDYELARCSVGGQQMRLTRDARRAFLAFATDPASTWAGNFRDLRAAVTRMTTLAEGGRVTPEDVRREAERLVTSWGGGASDLPVPAEIDLFDAAQLRAVIEVCRRCPTLSAAGRQLFAVSRRGKKTPNDADRLRKYLGRFGLTFDELK